MKQKATNNKEKQEKTAINPLKLYEIEMEKMEMYRPIFHSHELAFYKANLIKEYNRQKAINILKEALKTQTKPFINTTICEQYDPNDKRKVYEYLKGKLPKNPIQAKHIKELADEITNIHYRDGTKRNLSSILLDTLLVEQYTESLIKTIIDKYPDDPINQISELLDQSTKKHKNILYNKYDDFFYNEQYNKDISYILTDYAYKLKHIKYIPIEDRLNQVIRKKLTWHGNIKQLGTIAGALYKAHLIQGVQADLIRGLAVMFANIKDETKESMKESTLTKSIGLQMNTSNASPQYDPELLELMTPIIEYIKQTARTKKTDKNTAK